MKRAFVAVSNDLVVDQRVHKVCMTLHSLGFFVVLVGRKQRKSLPLKERAYSTKRMRLLFEKGPLFYAEYNIRLLFFLLFQRADLLVANDLDTLLGSYVVSMFKGIPLIYDNHEYFTGVPELRDRKRTRDIWKKIESFIFPKLKYVFAVNQSIANLYQEEYNVNVKTVRNVRPYEEPMHSKTRKELLLPENEKIILYQGAVNVDRGLEEAVMAMQYVRGAVLLIIGDGDILDQLKESTQRLPWKHKIIFKGRIPFEQLREYTLNADIGISVEKDTSLNYHYCLPNKFFDYIHAELPVLASPLVEILRIFSKYEVGELLKNHHPEHIAEKINDMLVNEQKLPVWKKNCRLAAKEYCWQHEEKEWIALCQQFL